VKAPELVADSELPTGHNGRVKVDRYLRVLDHSVGTRRGVADSAGITTSGRLAHLLKDAIEWEYRQSVRHLRGWDPVAV
jgi:NADH dehydrogenase FAD-containing subunit